MTSAEADRRSPGPPPPATVRSRVEVPLDLGAGRCTTALVHTFDGLDDPAEHLAIRLGPSPSSDAGIGAPLVRLHSECLTGDVLGSQRCDCGPQLRESLSLLDEVGGYLLYLRQEGRGVGLYAKLDAYVLQDRGLDTFDANLALGYPADDRDYTPAAQMLAALGLSRIRLLTNNPDKAAQLDRCGIEILERLPTGVHVTAANLRYLAAKTTRAQHTIDLPSQS